MQTYINNLTFLETAAQLKLRLYVVFGAHVPQPAVAKLIPQERSDTDRVANKTLKRSTGSILFFVSPSANMRLVGNQRTVPQVVNKDSLIMTTSILVRLSSIDVGADGEIKWS